MFAKRLISLRNLKELSQYEIAERLGFSRGQYANYEQGTREPDFETLQKLADFFEVSTDYLLGRTDDPEVKSDGEMYFFEKDKWSPEEIDEARAFIEARRQMKKNKK